LKKGSGAGRRPINNHALASGERLGNFGNYHWAMFLKFRQFRRLQIDGEEFLLKISQALKVKNYRTGTTEDGD